MYTYMHICVGMRAMHACIFTHKGTNNWWCDLDFVYDWLNKLCCFMALAIELIKSMEIKLR